MDAKEVRRDEIHIHDLPHNTTIQITNNFLSKVICMRKKSFKSWKSFYATSNCSVPFPYFKACFKPSFKQFRPLEILLKACQKLEISLQDLEKSVISYRFARSRIIINQPKLPVVVTPLFSMLVAHAIGDGCLNRFKNKQTVYLNYTQVNKQLRKLFISKTESVFGKIQYKTKYFEKAIRVYLPEVITRIIMNYFNLKEDSFLENNSEIPEKIFKLGRKHLLACLIAFIIDEGNIDSNQIVIGLNNRRLIEQISKICKLFNYNHTICPRKPAGQTLYILSSGVAKFWNDYLELKKEYPEIEMGYKENALKNIFVRLGKSWRSKGINQIKNLIINSLIEKPRTANELAELLTITRQGVRFQLKTLEKLGIIKKNEKAKNGTFIYVIVKMIKLLESNRGASRPIGITNSIVEKGLKETPLTTIQLVKKTGLKRDSLMNILYALERKNKIKRVGNVQLKTHPTIIWQNI